MDTTVPRRSFFMHYRAEDFPLYLLSLALTGALIVPALPYLWAQVALLAGLVYLGAVFVIRHGVKMEWSAFRAMGEGLAQYPGVLARSWKTGRHAVVPIVVIFALTLTAEYFLRPVLAGTVWLKPFPWQWAIWGPFFLVTAFRVAILIAHLVRISVVRQVVESSPQRKSFTGISMHNFVAHAFITGIIAHLCLVAPCVLFYMWTNPPVVREAMLLSGFLVWSAIAMPLRKRRKLMTPGAVSNRLVYQNHTLAHQSRFYFTVFHAHHHDVIPSALIGSAAGTGFFENADRSITWLDFLNSIVVVQVSWTYIIAFDMVVHQYIPGVFPYSKPNVIGLGHHVSHHWGSALPMGVIFKGYIDPNDMNNGYKPDNAVTRWFIAEVEKREGLEPALIKQFLSLDDYALRAAKKRSPAPPSGPDPATPGTETRAMTGEPAPPKTPIATLPVN